MPDGATRARRVIASNSHSPASHAAASTRADLASRQAWCLEATTPPDGSRRACAHCARSCARRHAMLCGGRRLYLQGTPGDAPLTVRRTGRTSSRPGPYSEQVPEGDTIHYAREQDPRGARRPRARTASRCRSGVQRGIAGRSGSQDGRARGVDAHGKRLFMRFEDGSTIHSHLRMSRRVARARHGAARDPRNTWLIMRNGGRAVVQFNGPVLELMTASRTRLDRRIARLGPDIVAPELDEGALPAPPAPGRPDARHRRRAARSADPGRDRQSVEGGGLLFSRGSTPGGGTARSTTRRRSRSSRRPARGCRNARATANRTVNVDLPPRRPAVPALRSRSRTSLARAGRRRSARRTGALDVSVEAESATRGRT